MEATNFDIRISREAALLFIKPQYFLTSGADSLAIEMGIEIMCKEYGQDEDWVGVGIDDYEMMEQSEEYQTFEIWLSEEQKKQIRILNP